MGRRAHAVQTVLCVWLISTAPAALAEPVPERAALLPSRDATLIESAGGALSSGAGPNLRAGRTGQVFEPVRRGLIAFDLASALPRGVEILDVVLILQMSASGGTPASVSLHRVTADWGEGSSASQGGQGAPSEPGDATWIHRFYDEVFWDSPGGDFAPIASGTAEMDRIGTYAWHDPGMVADVQLWMSVPSMNHGWILIGDEGMPSTVKRFDSREIPAPGVPPLLLVDYAPPAADDDEDEVEENDDG